MRFYTREECEKWLTDRGRTKPRPGEHLEYERFGYPKEPHGIYAIAGWVARAFTFRMPTLLWITEWGIWSSSENWHLYYRLRQTYGSCGLLHESPGHLFLEHESEDLASFTQLAMLNGWGGYILTQADYVNASFSHDEYIDFFADSPESMMEVRRWFSEGWNDRHRIPKP